MVLKELLSKVDKSNFEQAEKHVKDEDVNEKDFYKNLPTKYILLHFDHVIDGHHFIAKAKKLGITCSLNVLNLDPITLKHATNSPTTDFSCSMTKRLQSMVS